MKVQIILFNRPDRECINRFRRIIKRLGKIRELQLLIAAGSENNYVKESADFENVCSECGIPVNDFYVSRTADLKNPGRTKEIVKDFMSKEPADLTLFYGNCEGKYFGMTIAAELGRKCYTDVIDAGNRPTGLMRKVYNAHADAWYKLSGQSAVAVLMTTGPSDSGDGRNTAEGTAPAEWITGCYSSESMVITASEDKPETGGLENAELVFVGGRGLRNKDNFNMMIKAAERYNASWGCTRAAALSGWCSYSRVIGISGVQIKPKICILFGVSGAAPFVFGIENAETVIAVNKDRNAPVYRSASLGIPVDCISIVKRLAEGK